MSRHEHLCHVTSRAHLCIDVQGVGAAEGFAEGAVGDAHAVDGLLQRLLNSQHSACACSYMYMYMQHVNNYLYCTCTVYVYRNVISVQCTNIGVVGKIFT